MKKEDFIALGIDEELAEKAANASAEELKGFIPKARFDEVNTDKKHLDTLIKERDSQLEELKKNAGDSEVLKQQIETLQADNKAKDEAHEKEITSLKINNAIETALMSAKAKNTKAAKALLDLEGAELLEDGTVKGLDEQIAALKESDKYLFGGKESLDVRGAEFRESGDTDGDADGGGVDYSKMTYEEIVAMEALND